MKQYIKKSDLVAEINQRIEDYKSYKIDDSYHDGLIFALEDLRDDFLDTLEVKEVQEDSIPVSDDLEEASKNYALNNTPWDDCKDEIQESFKDGAMWQKEHLWKPADGDDLPEIDREVVVLTQPYSDDNEHLRVAFAHRPNKYANVWNSDLGEEQVVEIERHGKGGWNVPNIAYWLDCSMPKIEED